jgi:hypothetical protein
MLTNITINEDQISSSESSQSYPTLSTILFPDIGNDETSIHVDSEAQAEESFTIDNLNKASWATSKILEAEARITQRAELAKDFKNRIDLWLSSANQQDNNSISYLSFLLEPYVKNEVSKLHNSKTLSLPTGIASLRKLPDHIEITDPTAALAFCEAEHPEALIIKKELNKPILKDLILKQSEPIPGVSAELGSEKLYIKPLKIGESPILPQIAA